MFKLAVTIDCASAKLFVVCVGWNIRQSSSPNTGMVNGLVDQEEHDKKCLFKNQNKSADKEVF